MSAYSRTTTIDAGPQGDQVKTAVLDLDTDLTGIVAAYNAHDTATTAVHGFTGAKTGSGAMVGATSPALVTPTGIVKADVGLSSADNTSDAAKPVSTAQQTALDGKISHSLATAVNDFLVASGAGVFVKKTRAETQAIIGGGGITWSLITADPAPAVKNNGYMCNTTAAAFTLTLPAAPSAGDVVGITDGAGTFDTNNLTIGRNALKIMGLAEDMVVSTKNAAFGLVYASAALGWRIA